MDKRISREAIDEIIEAGRMMEGKGLMNAFEGNISVKKDGLLYITPTARSKMLLKPNEIAVLDEAGKQIAGDFPPSSEFRMHSAVYTVRGDIGSVAHCHSPYLTAYAICRKEFTCDCYPEFLTLFKEIKVAPYGAPGTHAIYEGALEILKERYVVLLANHGVLAIGGTALKACGRLDAAEAAAKIVSLARSIGTPVALPEAEIERIRGIVTPI